MKKLLIFYLTAMIVLTACGREPVKDGGDNAVSDPLHDFRNHIAAAGEPAEVKVYLDELMKEVGTGSEADTETADALVLEYLNYMEGILSGDQSDPADFPESAGFKFVSGEGGDYPVIDYRFIDAYSGQVSQEVKDFAGFMALNSDEPWAMDAGIIIPIRDLADRVAQAEQFIVSYPVSVIKDKVLIQYEYYLRAFLAGLDNTPLFPYETYKADPEFLEAYDYFIDTYPDLAAAETVAGFQAELEQMNYTAPYTYSEYEKKDAFANHIHELVENTVNMISQ